MELKPIGLFVPEQTSHQILNFYHAANIWLMSLMPKKARDSRARKQCLDDACTRLQHDPLGSQVLIDQMQGFLTGHLQPGARCQIKAALTYFQNQQ